MADLVERLRGHASGHLPLGCTDERMLLEEAAAALEAEASKGERRGLERAKAGWNACRKSIYAVCEDVDREADEARKHEGEHAKGYAAGMARAAKSIARGLNAMEAEDDDHFRALIPEAPVREAG